MVSSNEINRIKPGWKRCIKREYAESERSHVAPLETDTGWKLAGKTQPSGDTKPNRNGLTKNIRANYQYA